MILWYVIIFNLTYIFILLIEWDKYFTESFQNESTVV